MLFNNNWKINYWCVRDCFVIWSCHPPTVDESLFRERPSKSLKGIAKKLANFRTLKPVLHCACFVTIRYPRKIVRYTNTWLSTGNRTSAAELPIPQFSHVFLGATSPPFSFIHSTLLQNLLRYLLLHSQRSSLISVIKDESLSSPPSISGEFHRELANLEALLY